jgi:hypothetical protein
MMDSVGSVIRPGGPEEVSLMAEREIMFIVEGIPGQIPLDVAAEAMSAFTSFLQGTGDTTWALGTLAVGSACFGATAVGLSREETEARFREIITGMESVDAGAGAPETWSPSALSGLVAMARVADRSGTTGARIVSGETEVRMTRHLAEEVRRGRGAPSPRVAFGSVTGRVDRFMARDRRELGLIDEATGRPVTIRFSEDALPQVVGMVDRRVTVWGPLSRGTDGRKDVLTMEGFEVRRSPGADERLAVDDVAGSLGSDWTEGLGSVDWVREMRRG